MSNTLNTNDSWETRIENAAAYLGKTPKEVTEILKTQGVEEEPAGLEMLSDEEITPFGDFRRYFCDEAGIPVAKLRMAMKALRGPTNSKTTESIDPEMLELKNKFGYKINLNDLPTEDLLPYYNPTKAEHPVTKVLKARWGNKPVIVFKPGTREVAKEETANYIADLEQGYDAQEFVEVSGEPVRPLIVGNIPNEKVDEDPFYPRKGLRSDERSQVNRINWKDIDLATRQFCRILLENGEVNPNDRIGIRTFMKTVQEGLTSLKDIYPEVYVVYKERKEDDDLPRLRVSLKDTNGKVQNPFGINRSY